MTTSPKIVERAAQPYVAIKSLVSREEIGPVTGKLFGEVFGWLGQHGLAPAGAPFFRYGAVGMEQGVGIEFWGPPAKAVAGDHHVFGGLLPAGGDASFIPPRPYQQVYDADWAVGE